jgi:hypothetical protein
MGHVIFTHQPETPQDPDTQRPAEAPNQSAQAPPGPNSTHRPIGRLQAAERATREIITRLQNERLRLQREIETIDAQVNTLQKPKEPRETTYLVNDLVEITVSYRQGESHTFKGRVAETTPATITLANAQYTHAMGGTCEGHTRLAALALIQRESITHAQTLQG